MKIIYRLIYQSHINYIFRNLFKYFTNNIPISISGCLSLSFKRHKFKLLTNPTCYVTYALFKDGPEAYEFTTLFEKLILNSKVFFDIGANIGYFTILGNKINPSVHIYSFEPARGPLHYLKNNVSLNEAKNVTIIDKAVADQTGELAFFEVVNPKYSWLKYQLNGSNSLQNQHGILKSESYKVNVITLRDVIKHHNLTQLDLIKLDTECTEHYILNSSIDVIKEFRPIIVTEIYEVIVSEMELFIKQLDNYNIYHLDAGRMQLIYSLNDVHDSKERNFMFCPVEKIINL